MLRILLYFILGYLIIRIFRDLFVPKKPRDNEVYGGAQQKKKIEFNEKDIEDAKFEDIEDSDSDKNSKS